MDVSKFKDINLYLFDMDGTLYLGNRLYDFTKELLATIKATGSTSTAKRNNMLCFLAANKGKPCTNRI